MAEFTDLYEVRTAGLWSPRHRFYGPDGELGTLSVSRNARGMVVGATYRPERGEVLLIRREPGLLRSQFMLWTEEREWLGSSLRWSVLRRDIELHTGGGKPMHILPLPGLRCGWSLVAPKTGEAARMSRSLLRRRTRIDVFRRVDLETLVFAYFLSSLIFLESTWPGPLRQDEADIGSAARARVSA